MKNILAIETATPVCSVALQTADDRVKEKRIEGRGVHSEYTVQFIEELLERAGLMVDDLDGVYFSNGPGSYTGLRIGAAVLKGLLFKKEVPLFLFPTLLAFMAGQADLAGNEVQLHAAIDARRNHLYYQRMKANCTDVSDAQIVDLDQVPDMLKDGDIVIGTGWDRLENLRSVKVRKIGTEGISATALIRAGNHPELKKYFEKADVETFEPNYLTMSQINNTAING